MVTMDTACNLQKYSRIMKALDLHDFDRMCQRHLSCYAPKMKWALMSLEILAYEFKSMTDKNGVEYDTYPLFRFLRQLQSNLPLEMETINLLTKLKYLYFKRNLLAILKGNIFGEYLSHVKESLSSSATKMEEVLHKLLKVHHVLNVQSQLSNAEIYQYEFMADILKLCFDLDLQNSRLVITFLKKIIKMHSMELSGSRFATQPFYPNNFYKYLLKLSVKEKFDLALYCRKHPRTLWEYSRIFSISGAVSFGNYDRTLCLLQHGIEVFPVSEVMKSGHGFPVIEEIIPSTYLMILYMMSRIRSMNVFLLHSRQACDNGLFSVTNDQKKCFKLMWRAIPDPYVKQTEMVNAIYAEYFQLAQHAIFNPMRYEKNSKYCIMYETCFEDMASGPKEPRSLVHLTRCTIRQSLRKTWNLPHGISQLGLPRHIERYLNLEYD